MPRGFAAKQYIALVGISFSSMLLGGSCVHAYYKPDLVSTETALRALACTRKHPQRTAASMEMITQREKDRESHSEGER
jgi:hypothetical protein